MDLQLSGGELQVGVIPELQQRSPQNNRVPADLPATDIPGLVRTGGGLLKKLAQFPHTQHRVSISDYFMLFFSDYFMLFFIHAYTNRTLPFKHNPRFKDFSRPYLLDKSG